MGKVFRLHEGSDNIQDWQTSQPYKEGVINQIVDPNQATADKQITSIPSPFARIDLVKTAFKEVVNSNNLDGNSIYHRMVSDTLDVAEIFFNYEKLRDKLEIIVWNKKEHLDILKGSQLEGQKSLGSSLDMFLTQDAKAYNFDKVQNIYLLNFKIGPKPINIIGATSPATLFFCSANNLSYVTSEVDFANGDKPFDGDFQPLYKRDPNFVTYLWALMKSYPTMSVEMPELVGYLEKTYEKLDSKLKDNLQTVTEQTINDYDLLTFGASNQLEVEIINGLKYHVKPKVAIKSDFEISSTLYQGQKPLVLPVDSGNKYKSLNYVQGEWGTTNAAPYAVNVPLDQRVLPGDGYKYPFLTIGDLLEESIMRLPYSLNRSCFYDGNLKGVKTNICYLLPIKKEFFNFFTVEELINNNMLKLDWRPSGTENGSISATLRIPIQKDKFVEYSRLYIDGEADLAANIGKIINVDFDLGLMPNVKFNNECDAFYRVGIIPNTEDKIQLELEADNGVVNAEEFNREDKGVVSLTSYSVEQSNFNAIRVTTKMHGGYIIPIWNKEAGSDEFSFAIDFGTTNTHIEYAVNGSTQSKPIDIEKADCQIVYLNPEMDSVSQNIFDSQFIPELIGSGNAYFFPIRTILSEAKNANWNQQVLAYAGAGASFTYGKLFCPNHSREISNLKWSNDPMIDEKVKVYFESLFFMLRNKVLRNNGDLLKTKVVWFYPISMTRGRFSKFKKAWEEAYAKYFGGEKANTANIIPMTESVAPYEYYKAQKGAANMVTIDIGGGTTDVVVSRNGNVETITSFRFGANSIFGDGYATTKADLNGIVNLYKNKILDVLQNNQGLTELEKIYHQMDEQKDSAEFASFLFSLSENKTIVGKGLQSKVNYNELLNKDEKQKIVFLIFYVAIVYHIAKLMKAMAYPMPRFIAFSGNGSKIIPILTNDKELLTDLSKEIFARVYGETWGVDGLDILFNQKQPKESTCKGGISCRTSQDYNTISSLKKVLSGVDGTTLINDADSYSKVDNAALKNVVKQAEEFIDFVFELNKVKSISFRDNFSIDQQSIEIAKRECKRDLLNYTNDGFQRKMEEVDDPNATREETMFFYPLVGMLNNLANKIYEANMQ